ncbi:MAG: Trm112 family protein [Desulfuromonas sp.]|nr:Trm112 family protein [Desulfuromonas sp.]
MSLNQQLLDLLVCPQCKGELNSSEEQTLVCPHCQLAYPVRDGVPVMLIDEATPLEL